jgi:hypothetical protein
MKTSHLFFKSIALVICSLSLYSCLSIDRNIKLNKDGSGSETIRITFLKEFYGMMSSMTALMDSARRQGYKDSLYSDEIFINKTRSRYDSIPGVKIINISSERNSDSSNSFVIQYDFDSIKRIGSSFNELNDGNGMQETDVMWLNGGDSILFKYNYEQPVPEEIAAEDSVTEQMKEEMSQLFGNGTVHFEIEFPYEVVSSNSTSAEGNKLIWDFPVTDIIMTGKMDIEAVMREK